MLHKKQAHKLIEDICMLNQKQWNNPRGVFKPTAGAAMLIEEALELIGAANPRAHSREFVAQVILSPVEPVEQFDALLDSLYIAIGELHKFGATPEAIVEGLQVVHDKNVEKTGTKDATGKVVKPEGFVGPEKDLQVILDRLPKF